MSAFSNMTKLTSARNCRRTAISAPRTISSGLKGVVRSNS